MENESLIAKEQGFQSGIFYNIFIAVHLIASFLLQSLALKVAEKYSSTYYLLISLSLPFAFFAVILVGKKAFSLKLKNAMEIRRFSRTFSGLAIILSFGMFFGLGFINYLFDDFLSLIGLKTIKSVFILNGTGDYFISIVALCILPAVFEELFFRGVLLSGLKNAGAVLSSIISALFFALYHGSAAQLLYQFIYGYFLAMMTMRARSIYPAIISHFINNFAVLSAEYFGVEINYFSVTYIFMGLAFLAAFAFVMLLFGRNNEKRIKGAIFNLFVPFGIIGLAFCTLKIVSNFEIIYSLLS